MRDTGTMEAAAQTTPAPDTAAAAAATNRHYDLPVEVFAAFLGRRMKYTCGLYRDAESLDDAQEHKLRMISRMLALAPGRELLDIGCGWGSLTLYAAETFGCRVVAVAPSDVQTRHLREQADRRGLGGLVDVRRSSIQDADLAGRRFDAAAMVGVIEHMPDHAGVLAKAAAHLRVGGRLYVSASCHRDQATFEEFSRRPASRHVLESVFGWGTLRPLSQLLAGAESAGLSLSGLVDLTWHYHRTIEDWSAGVARAREDIEAQVPGLADELLRYFTTTNAGWGYTTKHYAFSAVRARQGETVIA